MLTRWFSARADRRARTRFPFRKLPLVRCAVRPSFHCFEGCVVDFSRHGLGLVLGRPLEIRDRLAVELSTGEGQSPFVVVGVVRNSSPLPDGGWRVGCELCRPLGDDELVALLAANVERREAVAV